ncbi:MAG: PolC-type DNA polymerase III, partial [Lachnospiraceae bacterium]|nr:PolC-type DNA polymerase III [Lachnospiraceae bacterium]
EGLIIGSACSAGELYDAILLGKTDEEIARIVEFYDYLEIQPTGNDAYLLSGSDNKFGVETVEDLQNINRRIVSLGEEFKKPVCATCDVHFMNPEDAIYRQIIMAGAKGGKNEEQPPLYFRTTEEMLAEFAYLGEDKAREVVIANTNMICDMCEPIAPVRPDKAPPVIADSDVMLRRICYTRAKELYGEDLPGIVTERLERELNSIISNGYAVMYIIAQKLVWKSVEDGYLVGSRGSVGSSFVATMAGITEVNPLHAHYVCPSCHYVDFDSEEVRAFDGRAGCDMPDKDCPVCGHKLNKDGFDIPFETFLGFKGDKEPDIDLNFSDEYQNKAHRYTEVIFGEGQTFRAGTIGTVADKTAYGYVKHFFEDQGIHKRGCEIDRIVQGCVGVRSTTGQHPGGIVVLPIGEDIYSFTPIQHPANKEIDIITTHFDYHKIEQNLLKLDILGHLDPTVIRMLEDLIPGLNATEIPLDDKGVMSLFMNTDALGVTPDDLWENCPLGTLGIPEFGTDFAMGMLIDAKPKEFTDLVRIAGLAHGTDVWLGNAKDLILEGKATISTAICTRDDIMTYLIGKGLDSEESFKIMEAVRKGMVAKGKCDKWADWRADMEAHDVPDWYIGSCEKIKYMFPKAHAAAYVMMAWRVAYCKINHPLEYYAAYFSIRAKNFSYEKMCLGKDTLLRNLTELKEKEKRLKQEKKTLSDNESKMYMYMRSVQEMYARGFEFLPMDLYASDPFRFKVVDGKLLPPLDALDGLSDGAEILSIEAHRSKFLSKDDLKSRGKVSGTIIDAMERLGIIKNLPESNQLSLFDAITFA